MYEGVQDNIEKELMRNTDYDDLKGDILCQRK